MKFLLLAFLGIGFASCENQTSYVSSAGDSYEKTKVSLADQERSNPAQFLKTADVRRDRVRRRDNDWTIRGEIQSAATVASFKDIQITIQYISVTNTVIREETKVVYDVVGPRGRNPFKLSVIPPDGASTANVYVIGGTPL